MTDREINAAIAGACGRGNPTAIRPLPGYGGCRRVCCVKREIRLTRADVGKAVRLRDGSTAMIVRFRTVRPYYPFWVERASGDGFSVTAGGRYNACPEEYCSNDIVEVIEERKKEMTVDYAKLAEELAANRDKARVDSEAEKRRLKEEGCRAYKTAIRPLLEVLRSLCADKNAKDWLRGANCDPGHDTRDTVPAILSRNPYAAMPDGVLIRRVSLATGCDRGTEQPVGPDTGVLLLTDRGVPIAEGVHVSECDKLIPALLSHVADMMRSR